jgi:acetyl esterase
VLYPQARKAVQEAAGDPKIWETDIGEARRAAREEAAAQPRENVAEVVDLDADGVPCWLYRPDGARPGLLVHLHVQLLALTPPP